MTRRELLEDKADGLEEEARQAKEQLAEMARTANEYSTMIQRKEERIASLQQDLDASAQASKQAAKEIEKREKADAKEHVS